MSNDSTIRVFVSYSRGQSLPFVDYLEQQLKFHNIASWIDTTNIHGGEKWLSEIRRGIDECSVFLLILTPEAVKSPWVNKELRYARKKRKPIIPLIYYPCNVPKQLGTLQFIDFVPDMNFEGKFAANFPKLLASVSEKARQYSAMSAQSHRRSRAQFSLVGTSILLVIATLLIITAVVATSIYWNGEVQAQSVSIHATVVASVKATNTAAVATNEAILLTPTTARSTSVPLVAQLATSPVTMTLNGVDWARLQAGDPAVAASLMAKIRAMASTLKLADKRAGLVIVYGGAAGQTSATGTGISRAVVSNVLKPLGQQGYVFDQSVYQTFFDLSNPPTTIELQIFVLI